MPHSKGTRRPLGSLAWRQYEVKLGSDHQATVGFSLADPHDKTIAEIGSTALPIWAFSSSSISGIVGGSGALIPVPTDNYIRQYSR
jgi:hypothetical protein